MASLIGFATQDPLGRTLLPDALIGMTAQWKHPVGPGRAVRETLL